MRLALALAAVGMALTFSGTALAAPGDTPVASCSDGSGTVACDGWHTEPVTLHWDYDSSDATPTGCDDYTQTDDTTGVESTCKVDWGTGEHAEASQTLKVDGTGPVPSDPLPAPDHNGWYNAPVILTFGGFDAISGLMGCSSAAYSGPDDASASVTGSCTDNAGNSSPASFGFQYDATPPDVTPGLSRPADYNGWYNQPVETEFGATDATSGPAGCPAVTYSGPDSATATVSAGCSDNAGNSASASWGFMYDATPPVVTATPSRGTDHGVWYNEAVVVSFSGTDALSGNVVCNPATATYSGVELTSSCTDAAGNVASGSFASNYDNTPPTLTNLTADDGDSEVTLTWVASTDTTSVDLVRSAPGEPDKHIVVATTASSPGGPGAYTDTTASNGTHYTYTVTAHDRADNRASASIGADPRAALHETSPVKVLPINPVTKKVASAPMLKWRKVKSARYYNVQLYHGRVKILSIWPRTNTLQLSPSWTYAGKKRSLRAGTYKWYVWPGFGARKAAKYGGLIKKGAFRVKG